MTIGTIEKGNMKIEFIDMGNAQMANDICCVRITDQNGDTVLERFLMLTHNNELILD